MNTTRIFTRMFANFAGLVSEPLAMAPDRKIISILVLLGHPYKLPQARDLVLWCLFGARLVAIRSPAPSKLVRGRWRPERMV